MPLSSMYLILFHFLLKLFLNILLSGSICYNINMRIFHPVKRNNSLYQFYPDYKDYCKTLKILQDFTYEVSGTLYCLIACEGNFYF